MNNTIQTQNRMYSNPLLEKMVEDRHAVLLEQFAKFLGKKHAQMGKPSNEEELILLTSATVAEYNRLALICHQKCDATLEQKQGSNEVLERNLKNVELNSKIDALQTDVTIKKQQVTGNKPSRIPMFMLSIGIFLTMAIFLGESYFNGVSMQLLGGGLLLCLLLGIGIASSMAVIARYVPDIIREKVPHSFQKIAWIILGLFIIGVFTALSYFRVAYIEKSSSTTQISHLPFIFFNLLFFIAFCLVAQLVVKPTFKSFQSTRQSMKAHQEIEKLEKKIMAMKNEMKANDDKLKESLQTRLILIAYAKSMQEKVKNLYHITISTYLQTNIEYRTDHVSFSNWTPTAIESYDQDINI